MGTWSRSCHHCEQRAVIYARMQKNDRFLRSLNMQSSLLASIMNAWLAGSVAQMGSVQKI